MVIIRPDTLLTNIALQPHDLFITEFNQFPETEIILLSGVSKSGAVCIIHAGGCGGLTHRVAGCGELQPVSAIRNSRLQFINSPFCIC